MRRSLPLVFALGVIAQQAAACLWDRDTLKDEIAMKKGVEIHDLIVGKVPHHGVAYYGSRIWRLEGKLRKGTATDGELNDLAVAHIRVGQFDKAEKLLKLKLASDPKHYVSLSNLGVLEKKRGNYTKAAKLIGRALEVKPEGHMGLGDWYLKMLRYRAELDADPKLFPEKNFLGIDYAKSFGRPNSFGGKRSQVDVKGGTYEKLSNLLRNDQTFADGFVAMGDYLTFTRDLNLAYLAYWRALELGHRNPREVNRRIAAIDSYWKDYRIKEELDFSPGGDEVSQKFAEAARWLEQFQAVEEKLVEEKGDTVSFAEVMEALDPGGDNRAAAANP